MPYKDLEKRRAFDRFRKSKRRGELKKLKALAGIRLYFCQRYPGLYVHGVGSFIGGFLIVRDPEDQAKVEEHELFWVNIFPIQLDLSCIPQALPE